MPRETQVGISFISLLPSESGGESRGKLSWAFLPTLHQDMNLSSFQTLNFTLLETVSPTEELVRPLENCGFLEKEVK